jgi:hypothetical protein
MLVEATNVRFLYWNLKPDRLPSPEGCRDTRL